MDRIEPSHIATESTYVEAQGRTKYGEESDLLFHVSSADWQESDRVFAGVLTAFGSTTKAIPIGGYGTFDGSMTGAFNSPRIEGEFSGEQMRAWDVVWGSVRGKALIQNSYVDVDGVTITLDRRSSPQPAGTRWDFHGRTSEKRSTPTSRSRAARSPICAMRLASTTTISTDC